MIQLKRVLFIYHRQIQKKVLEEKKVKVLFEIQIDIKIKSEKKQSSCTNPDAWGRLIGRITTSPIFLEGHLVTSPFGYWLTIIHD